MFYGARAGRVLIHPESDIPQLMATAPQAHPHFTRIERVLDHIHTHLDAPLPGATGRAALLGRVPSHGVGSEGSFSRAFPQQGR